MDYYTVSPGSLGGAAVLLGGAAVQTGRFMLIGVAVYRRCRLTRINLRNCCTYNSGLGTGIKVGSGWARAASGLDFPTFSYSGRCVRSACERGDPLLLNHTSHIKTRSGLILAVKCGRVGAAVVL